MKKDEILELTKKLDKDDREDWEELITQKPEINWAEIAEILMSLSVSRIQLIRWTLKKDVPMEYIRIIAQPEFDDYQSYAVYDGLINIRMDIERVKIYAKPCVPVELMKSCNIKNSFRKGDIKKLKKYFNAQYNVSQLTWVLEGIVKLSEEQIDIYAKPEFNERQMKQCYGGFMQGLSIDQVKFYARPEFDCYQMAEIREGYKDNLTKEQIEFYAKPEIPNQKMIDARKGFAAGLTMEQIEYCIGPQFTFFQSEVLIKAFKKGLTKEQIEVIAKKSYYSDEMERCMDLFVIYGLSVDEVKKIETICMRKVIEGLREGFSLEQMSLFATTDEFFYDGQVEQIMEGFRNGLSIDSVKIYARPKYSYELMKVIREALEYGATKEEIEEIINNQKSLNTICGDEKQLKEMTLEKTLLYKTLIDVLS